MWLAVETRNRIVLGAPKWLIKGMRRNLFNRRRLRRGDVNYRDKISHKILIYYIIQRLGGGGGGAS